METGAEGWLSPQLLLPIMRDGAFYILLTLAGIAFVFAWQMKKGNIVTGEEARQKGEIAQLRSELDAEKKLCAERIAELQRDINDLQAQLASLKQQSGGGR